MTTTTIGTTIGTFDEGGARPGSQTDQGAAGGQVRPGGLSLPVLVLAALVASPAIWQCLVSHTVPVQVMLERYVLIALGCLLVSAGVGRLLWSSARPATTGAASTGPGSGADETQIMPTVLPTVDDPAMALDAALSVVAAED